MKLLINILAAIGALSIVLTLVLALVPAPEYKIYDCSVAEFHPDYPPDVREQCRKQRRGLMT
jgi:hypothetical protein